MTPTNDEVRQQFEATFSDCNLRRLSPHSDCYEDDRTALRWEGYQAALRSPVVAGLVAELATIANADPAKWDADVRDQFREWSQNRARAALAQYATLAGESQ